MFVNAPTTQEKILVWGKPARWAPVAMFLHHTFRQLAIDIAAGTRPSPPGDVVMFDFNSKLLVSMTCSCCLLFDEHH
ncbi:hypothetical protein SFRURICE_006968 [Spodoptera frugiperda]|nr:hypothetical protein SFRURICE_006968 [Spodoptera frugiperda]